MSLGDRIGKFFRYSRADRMGVVGLVLILILLMSWRVAVSLERPEVSVRVHELVVAQPLMPERLKIVFPVDINIADSATLVALRGIGPATAKRILKYREQRLFDSIGQLKAFGSYDANAWEWIKSHTCVGCAKFGVTQ